MDEGFIYYRWHYSDDSEDYGIEQLRNGPRIRWLLYTTGLENPGMFFYSINEEDLAIDPTAGTPRIGPYAPPIPAKGSTNLTLEIRNARTKIRSDFDNELAVANETARQNNDTGAGKIYCRWHFTDMKRHIIHPVIPCINTQPVRDLLTEYLVRYPNQFWVSFDEQDMLDREVDSVKRPKQGLLLPTGVGPSTLDLATLATPATSAAASVSTTGTGLTHDPPLPTEEPATKKAKSNAGTTKPTMVFINYPVEASGSSAGTGPTHHAPGMPKSTPAATVAKPPTPPGTPS